MKKLVHEPLVHFLLVGAALFVIFSLRPDQAAPADDHIVVSADKIKHLAVLFARTWQRPPTPAELEGLVDEYVREEAAYREGLALGLDSDDTIIRRRLRQKLDFIAEDLVGQIEPTDEVLGDYLAAHVDDFRIDPRFSFCHVYLNPDQRGEDVDTDARELLVMLNGDPSIDPAALGDRILLEHAYADVSARDIAGLFGRQFASAVAELRTGDWHGPIRSGYGVHLVRLDGRSGGRIPELAEVYDAVRREWENAGRLEVLERFYREMLQKYEVTIEWPEAKPNGGDE
ncbi:MAG: peptidyl-prolyl cis-trans isomerase [Phycisphaerales bacterium]|nr:MAG: peptidyl-prolyl cis-trans isomerase [Phycisphaerales bacterium]